MLFHALCCFAAHASDDEHRATLQRLMMATSPGSDDLRYPFISQMYLQREQGVFTLSSGQNLISVPNVVNSAYDSSVTHQIGDFYQPKEVRQRWVVNYLLPASHWLVSFGYDSGLQADKLSIQPSVFLGAAKNMTLTQNQYLLFSWGQWFGGKVTERSCMDTYDREYWCPTLVAWKDRPALDTQPGKYLELRYLWLF